MTVFQIKTQDNQTIRFRFYQEEAPQTTDAFLRELTFSRLFFHARVSGREIWIDDALLLDVPQENASVFTEPGEITISPVKPQQLTFEVLT